MRRERIATKTIEGHRTFVFRCYCPWCGREVFRKEVIPPVRCGVRKRVRCPRCKTWVIVEEPVF